jgi:hypothetical protein
MNAVRPKSYGLTRLPAAPDGDEIQSSLTKQLSTMTVQSAAPASTVEKSIRNTLVRIFTPQFRWVVLGFKILGWWTFAFCAIILGFFLLATLKPLLVMIPLGIQLACVGLIAMATTLLVLMMRERRRVLDACERFLDAFEHIKPATQIERHLGLPPESMAEIRRRGNSLRGKPREWWRSLEESFECYTSMNGGQGWFITRQANESLSEDDVISALYHSSFYQVVPSILTALGLLATFIAILVALNGVTYDPQDATHPITGIDKLINGLAGKFLSSIVALILSVIFIFFEKKVCERQILRGYDSVIRRSKEILPFLSQARILLDIQRLAASQSGIIPPSGVDQRALGD